jgi:hypothetical protein
VDECRQRLERAGWVMRETVVPGSGAWDWLVTGILGSQVIAARGITPQVAWWQACLQAELLGLLAPEA